MPHATHVIHAHINPCGASILQDEAEPDVEGSGSRDMEGRADGELQLAKVESLASR